MLSINETAIVGATFQVLDPNITYTCIGYGQDPTTGANYVVGVQYDSVNNRSIVRTFLFKDANLKFTGKTPDPIVK
jgi:hypothetical protein